LLRKNNNIYVRHEARRFVELKLISESSKQIRKLFSAAENKKTLHELAGSRTLRWFAHPALVRALQTRYMVPNYVSLHGTQTATFLYHLLRLKIPQRIHWPPFLWVKVKGEVGINSRMWES
jgi:hypothetical protein